MFGVPLWCPLSAQLPLTKEYALNYIVGTPISFKNYFLIKGYWAPWAACCGLYGKIRTLRPRALGLSTQSPKVDPKNGSTLGLCNLHCRSIRVQNWFLTLPYTIPYCGFRVQNWRVDPPRARGTTSACEAVADERLLQPFGTAPVMKPAAWQLGRSALKPTSSWVADMMVDYSYYSCSVF